MKIAIASLNDQVSQHFGHCQSFGIFTVENGIVSAKTSVPNPEHRPGFLPLYLQGLGVTLVVSGGMGAGAVERFGECGIAVITGASGTVESVLAKVVDGTLVSTGKICQEHRHQGKC